MKTARYPMNAPRRSMQGISMVELMIAMVLGLIVMAGLASIFANSSAARAEMERSSRQIENGRFAMELLADDLRLAGFYGELNVRSLTATTALQDPCSFNPVIWAQAISVGVQGYDNGLAPPGCIPPNLKPGTDILVVRRASGCEAGSVPPALPCDPAVDGLPYVQVSKCSPENVGLPPTGTPYKIGVRGGTVVGQQGATIVALPNFNLNFRNCATTALVRRYFVRIYYIATDNGGGLPIPTLTRLDLTGAAFPATPMVEGIEELNIEYGMDTNGDGNPDDYNADPTSFTKAGCATCNAYNNWFNVVTARVSLLARNIDPSPNYTDVKTYTIGRDAGGVDVTVTPGGAFRRHAYSGLVRVVNVAQRKEAPP